MKIAPVAEVKAHFSDYLKAAQGGPIVVTRNGRPAVVMIAVPSWPLRPAGTDEGRGIPG